MHATGEVEERTLERWKRYSLPCFGSVGEVDSSPGGFWGFFVFLKQVFQNFPSFICLQDLVC